MAVQRHPSWERVIRIEARCRSYYLARDNFPYLRGPVFEQHVASYLSGESEIDAGLLGTRLPPGPLSKFAVDRCSPYAGSPRGSHVPGTEAAVVRRRDNATTAPDSVTRHRRVDYGAGFEAINTGSFSPMVNFGWCRLTRIRGSRYGGKLAASQLLLSQQSACVERVNCDVRSRAQRALGRRVPEAMRERPCTRASTGVMQRAVLLHETKV
jgi:hypothetical protein